MQSKAKTVKEYLDELPIERRKTITAVRTVIVNSLPHGYEETMNWGMISYEIPLKVYPNTYNKRPLGLAALASQKHYISLYLMCVYMNSKRMDKLQKGFSDMGINPNMGKSCIRFKTVDQIPLEILGEIIAESTVDDYIKRYEEMKQK
ncbi:MAG: DUF1801 domain-containing protein [Fidelibacterota bacterium]